MDNFRFLLVDEKKNERASNYFDEKNESILKETKTPVAFDRRPNDTSDDSTDDSKLEDISKLYPRMNYNDIVALDKVFNEILKKKEQKLIDSNQFQIICLDLFPHIKREILSNDSESRDDVLNFLKQLYTYGDGSSNEEMDFNNLVNIIHITKFGTLVEQFNLCMNLMAEKNIEKDQFYIVLKHLFLISYEGEFNLEKKKKKI